MKRFVFWTGVYNIPLGAAFLFPSLVSLFGINAPESAFWLRLPAAFCIFAGIALILCSRDLATRGSIVYWEGILRLVAAGMLAVYGFFGDLGMIALGIGAIDLLIGLGYLIGLPSALQLSPKQLLLDELTGETH